MWSWISRGMCSMEQLAQWRFDSDVSAAELAMSQTRNGMVKLYSLDAIPDDPPQEIDGAEAEIPLEGETVTFWSISELGNKEAVPIPLPQWFQLPISNVILTWKKEREIWDKRLEKRRDQGHQDFAPKAKAAHEAWMNDREKVLILDKKKQALVKHPEKKSQATLRRTCLALVIHPATDPDDMWIKAGTGKKWALKLLRGESIHDVAVPKEVDHFGGGGTLFVKLSTWIYIYIHIFT